MGGRGAFQHGTIAPGLPTTTTSEESLQNDQEHLEDTRTEGNRDTWIGKDADHEEKDYHQEKDGDRTVKRKGEKAADRDE